MIEKLFVLLKDIEDGRLGFMDDTIPTPTPLRKGTVNISQRYEHIMIMKP